MGGAESRIMDVFRNIDRDKFQFDFLAMTYNAQYYDQPIAQLGGRMFRLPSPRESGIVKNLQGMYRIFRKEKFDVVHAHTSFHGGLAAMAAFFAGVRIRIVHGRTTGSKTVSKSSKLSLFIGKILIRLFATHRLAISSEAGKYLFGNSKFNVLPNAIDLNRYLKVQAYAVDELRNNLGISPDASIIGMVGRFESMKNHVFTINWFAEFHRQHPNAYLVLVGDGVLRLQMEEMSRVLGVSSNVLFTGVQQNIPVYMKLFDVLIVPSLFEGLCGTILEAQAAGTPVVKSTSFTNEADMGLGLVVAVSLKENYATWSSAVNQAIELKKPSEENIVASFRQRKYTLDDEIQELQRIYSSGIERK